MALAAGLAVVAVVAAVDPAGQAPFGPAKWAVATTSVFALGAVIAWRRSVRVARVPMLLFVAFVGWTGVTAVAGVDPLYAWTGTPERHAGVVAWALCALAFYVGQSLRDTEYRTMATAVSVAAVVAGAWAIVELLGWTPLHLTGVTDRPGGSFGSSAYLGAAMALLAPPAWGLALDASTRRRVRAVAVVGAGFATVALVASGARAAWLGALVAAVALVVRRGPTRRTAVVAAAGLAFIIAVAVATGVAGRAPDLVGDDRGGVAGRLDEWRVAGRVVADHPVLGVGPEGYRIAFTDSVDEAYEQAHGRHPLPDRAHSAVLDVAATTGLPGVALYLALLGVLAALAWRALRHPVPWVAGTACGVLAYFVQSLVLFPIPELDVVAWLLAGTVVARAVRRPELSARRRHPYVAVAAAALAVVAAVAGTLDIAADRAVTHDTARAARFRPDALRYHLAAARSHEANGAFTDAIRQVERAERVSPRDPVVERELARLFLERARRTRAEGDIDTARAALEDLARRDPHNAETQLRLGLARVLDADDRGAEQAWLAAERLAPRSAAASTNLSVMYERRGRGADARQAAERARRRGADGT